jgi:putative copper export protein
MTGLEILTIALRALTYIGSIAAAGGILFRFGFPRAAGAIRGNIERQIVIGCCLLLLVEPARYAVFQLSIAGSDWSLAFGADLRWMAIETPMGRAALARLAAAAVILLFGLRSHAVSLIASVTMIGSFALEGHTASSEAWTPEGTGALLIHVAAVHWWLGALYPLLALAGSAEAATLPDVVETFGRRAAWIVAGLIAGGALVIVTLSGGRLNLESAYQLRFLLKLGIVALLLLIAARNKFHLTPLLRRDHESGRRSLRKSIGVEMSVALAVLLATAWAINSSPDG